MKEISHSDIKNSLATIKGIQTKVGDAANLMKEFSGNLFSALDCRVVRREVQILQNVVCYQFVNSYAKTSDAIAYMGPILFFFAMCMCCTIRCKNANTLPKNAANGGKINPLGYK